MIGTMLAAAGFAAALLLTAEGYFLIGRAQRLLDYAEQLHQAGALLLAAVPSKSAPRTDGSNDVPAEHWGRLVEPVTQPQPVVRAVPTDTLEAVAVVQETVEAITAEVAHYGRHRAPR